jgi:uncharacterized protein DUF222
VFGSGLIDERMVAIIIARTENVEDETMTRLDAALAGHCVNWMRLSGPKLCDRIDMWVAYIDPSASRITRVTCTFMPYVEYMGVG